MNKIINGSNKYLLIIEMLVVISIVLSITYSNYFVESSNHRAAEMYIGSLKYSMKIDSNETNTLSLKPGVTVIDVDVNNLNPVDTYYKLLYLNNSNLEIKYFSETKDTDEVKTSYKSPNDSVTSSNTNNLKLFIRNNSDTNQDVSFSLKGGYINNTLSDISVPSGYSEITIDNSSNNTYFCKTSDTLTQGLEYVNGQYTYGYMKEGHNSSSGLAWSNISNDGWGVQLTDKASTDAITSKICSYINNKPLVSAAGTFNKSKATILNLDGLNTSNIINMNGMFSNTQITTLDVSKFNTSNVKDMGWMFSGSQATALDLSNFNTSNVTNMEGMFNKSEATALDLSNFNTSNVTNMRWMFSNSQATTLDLSNFNTSNVTNMEEMFYKSQATTLDVSSFNTSNVTDMSFMFNNSIKLKTIYASNKFKTDLVTSSSNMFYNSTLLVGGSGTTYNSSYVDKTYARIDGGTSRPGYFTDIANKPSTFGTDDWATIVNSVKAGNTNHYKVGDTKIVNLGTYGTHTIRVSNTTTPSECSNTNFSQSACGFVLEFEDIITTHVINTTSSNKNGWPASSMRTFVNNDIYNALPADLRNGIINTTTISSHGSSDSANFLSTDKLYLLATAELYENGEDIDTAKNLTRQLDYYKSIGVTINSYSGAIKKSGTTATDWWLRSFYKTNNQHVYSVLRTGRVAHSMASLSIGVSPAFRID